VLILFHASAAIYHHAVQKDDILRRMLPGARRT
jgi:cytochrome b561